ncbi:hypothetical protein HELRODRAFT_164062 [Helobdella robusta]|uniref:Uncharacterized protein n=1 Tax=Helobdella robusta TaxID=6412 RepID=T1EUU9_HELRO|nr:hypothetical protein HELRODRAFT_164062 [Helobdella robusta]ESN94256.1 hypothetical protein HELRODRAFT_164062 [Helobdella robusta]
MFKIIKCPDDLKSMQLNVTNMQNWLNVWRMIPNVDKCCVLKFGNKYNNIYEMWDSDKRLRNFEAVRLEIITCAKNFLERRLDVDQDLQVKAIIDVANAENAESMIKTGRQIVSDIFGDNYVSEFVDDAIGYYSSFGASSFKPHESNTAKLYLLLQKTTPSSVLNKLVQTFLITCPHSMITERVISCHTELKSDLRSSMSRNTVNDRLCIALNAIGTANFDPRPVVADFLSSKTRRSTLPDDELYRNREFVKNENFLDETLLQIASNDQIMQPLTTAMMRGTTKKFQTVLESDEHRVATILHPRFNLSFLHDDQRRMQARHLLLTFVQQVQQEVFLKSNATLPSSAAIEDYSALLHKCSVRAAVGC